MSESVFAIGEKSGIGITVRAPRWVLATGAGSGARRVWWTASPFRRTGNWGRRSAAGGIGTF